MDIHPWTKYEIARLRDEERLLRARHAWHFRELREARPSKSQAEDAGSAISWLDRIRRRQSPTEQAPVGSGAV